MTESDALDAIYQRWEDGFEAIHPDDPEDPEYVAWTAAGEAFDPPVGIPWIRISIQHTAAQQMTMGAAPYRRWERRGNVFVQIFAPTDGGVKCLSDLAEDVRTVLEGRRIGELNLYEGRTAELGEDGKWSMSTVVIPFRYVHSR